MRFSYMTQAEHTQNAIDRSGQGFVITGQDDDGVTVFNPHTNKTYYITIADDVAIDCTCEHSFYRKCNCKHLVYAAHTLGILFDKRVEI